MWLRFTQFGEKSIRHGSDLGRAAVLEQLCAMCQFISVNQLERGMPLGSIVFSKLAKAVVVELDCQASLFLVYVQGFYSPRMLLPDEQKIQNDSHRILFGDRRTTRITFASKAISSLVQRQSFCRENEGRSEKPHSELSDRPGRPLRHIPFSSGKVQANHFSIALSTFSPNPQSPSGTGRTVKQMNSSCFHSR
jgi:hypothetical protein